MVHEEAFCPHRCWKLCCNHEGSYSDIIVPVGFGEHIKIKYVNISARKHVNVNAKKNK